MVSEMPRKTVRIEQIYLDKLEYMAWRNRRYMSQELCYALISHVERYEKARGEITEETLKRFRELIKQNGQGR